MSGEPVSMDLWEDVRSYVEHHAICYADARQLYLAVNGDKAAMEALCEMADKGLTAEAMAVAHLAAPSVSAREILDAWRT